MASVSLACNQPSLGARNPRTRSQEFENNKPQLASTATPTRHIAGWLITLEPMLQKASNQNYNIYSTRIQNETDGTGDKPITLFLFYKTIGVFEERKWKSKEENAPLIKSLIYDYETWRETWPTKKPKKKKTSPWVITIIVFHRNDDQRSRPDADQCIR